MERPSHFIGFIASIVLASSAAGAQTTPTPTPTPTPATTPATTTPTQPPFTPHHALIADLGLHVIGVAYEHVFRPEISGQIALEYYQPWTTNGNTLGLDGPGYTHSRDLSGGGVRARVFVFPFGAAPAGLWISPFGQLMYVRSSYMGASGDGLAWALGLSVGYSLVVLRGLVLRLGLGIQYHHADAVVAGENQGFSGFYPQIEIQAGWAF